MLERILDVAREKGKGLKKTEKNLYEESSKKSII